MAISGGFMTIFLNNYFHAFPTWTWPIFTLAFVGLAAFLMIRGVHISTRWAGVFFVFEFVILLLVSIIAIIQHAGHLTLHPFNPHYLASGVKGLGLGFPLAVYMFIGWEAAGPLAEETDQPRKNIPRALFASVALMLGSFVLFAYATVEAFGENVDKLTAAPIPFITVARQELAASRLPGLRRRRDLDGGLPDRRRQLAGPPAVQLGPRGAVPQVAGQGLPQARHARSAPSWSSWASASSGCFGWAVGQHITPLTLFAEPSTLGTILVIVVYAVANLALPFFYLKHYREPVQHRPRPHPAAPRHGGRSSTRCTSS